MQEVKGVGVLRETRVEVREMIWSSRVKGWVGRLDGGRVVPKGGEWSWSEKPRRLRV